MTILDHRQNRVDTGRPNGLFGGQLCPHHVLFGHDDDVNSLTVPSRQRLRQFPEKNDATATRTLLPHRRVKTIISLSHNNPLVCVRHTVCLYSSPDLSAGQCFPPKCAHKGPARCRIAQDSCAHRPFKVECAQQKPIPRCLWQVLRAHFGERHRREMQPTKAWVKGIAAECNRRRPASCHDTDPLPIPSVSLLRIRIFGPELCRGTDATREWSVSWQRKNSESRTRNTPFPSTRVELEGDYQVHQVRSAVYLY